MSMQRLMFPALVGLVVLLFGAMLLLDLDLLLHGSDMPAEPFRLEIEEAMLLGTVLVIGLGLFGFHRLNMQRRELEARLSAETRARQALEIALIDPLTGIANRRHFDDTFHAAAAGGGPGTVHALLLLDLDGFKAVNDTFGHPAGDEVLRAVSQRLQGAVKKSDLVSRIGGDEFAVIAFNLADESAAEALVERVRATFERPIVTSTGSHPISASIGRALFPMLGADSASIFKAADEALYEEKHLRKGASAKGS
jgi:diguanylate cyclase (GGDEF)-like protein